MVPKASLPFLVLLVMLVSACTPAWVGSEEFSSGVEAEGSHESVEFDARDGYEGTINTAFITVAGVDADGLNASVSGYISPVRENGVRCIFTFVQGERSITRESVSVASGSLTSCGLISVPVTELGRGSWEVTLHSDHPEFDVVPGTTTMEVP